MSADGIQQQQDIYPYTHQSPVQVFRTTVKDIWRLLIHQNPICHRFTGCTINGNADKIGKIRAQARLPLRVDRPQRYRASVAEHGRSAVARQHSSQSQTSHRTVCVGWAE